MIASGLDYVTMLKLKGYSPMVVTMTLGGQLPSYTVERAINYAVNNGVIVVAAAGNNGPGNFFGMTWPGAFPQVISVGAAGWVYEWYGPGFTPPVLGTQGYPIWWLQSDKSGYNDIPGTLDPSQVYVPFFSSRENQRKVAKFSQQLDVLAPGSWVRGPFPKVATPSHTSLDDPRLPWWSQGEEFLGKLPGANNFFFVSGTSAATPHVASVAALMLEKYPGLAQADVEMILKTTALHIPPGERTVYDPVVKRLVIVCWECGDISTMAPATGAGLVQADRALAATPGFATAPPLPLLPALPLPARNDPFRENTNMTILNPVPSLYSIFGGAIAAFGDDILIGDTLAGAGTVYLFNGTTATLVRTFANPRPAPHDNFGVSLAVSEDRVLVGANSASVGALEAGVAYVFNGTTGQLLQTILNPDPQPGDWFGRSVANLGNDFVISANGKNDLWGTVYIFDNSGSLIHTVMNPKTPPGSVPGTGLSTGDAFGTSIAVVGNNILVGAPGGYHRTNPGTAYLFDGSTGQLIFTFHSQDPDSFDFGLSVAAAGTNVLIGSPHDNTLWPNAGAAYLFDASTGKLLHTFLNPSPQAHFLRLAGFGGAGDRFGDSVAAIGKYILVGADLHDAGVLREVPFAGAAYAFDSSTGQLVHVFPDPFPHAFDWFGFSIEIVKESIVISTFGGAVYVYRP